MDGRIWIIFMVWLVESCGSLSVQRFLEKLVTQNHSIQWLHVGGISIKHRRSAMVCPDNRCLWPKSNHGTVKVPYTLSSYTGEDADKIIAAMKEFALMTCVHFVNRTTESDYVHIVPGDGCWSSIGRKGGPQKVSLGSGCLSKGSIQHELNHVLGFHHEHSRSDRDEYVRIVKEFIPAGRLSNFKKENTNNLGLEYDYSSVMHYGRYAYSNTSGQETIIPIKNPAADIGQTIGLSNMDLAKINRLYNCGLCSIVSRRGYGFVSSTDFPSYYPNHTDCSYLIQTGAHQILLMFSFFDIKSSPNCESDYIIVYDGMTKDAPILLNKACESVPPVVSSGSAMLLRFVTNGTITASGFKAHHQNIACAHAYTTSPGIITSKNYPQNYPAKVDCGYYIWAAEGKKISLTFTDFDLEPHLPYCRLDYLVIFDGPTNRAPLIGRYCGSGPVPPVVSSGNLLVLQFHSDRSVEKRGFQATYTFVEA
ncbi:hypothetical protein NDU88_007808 [Pleurodeles waltl]|uniref:Metalloendopeptidase n=1 Tax=Pleurodeles waltl TaxID=8319 RepID=A0AAV7U2P8_PLEWA|nr:hypothetical protein NDU88_007808 [Pleurodeles waltl]